MIFETDLQLEEEREYERVFYDGLTFKETLAKVQEEKVLEAQAIVAREKEISENFITMKKELKAWRLRVESKNKLAEAERLRKEKILAEVSF